jgi:hypothetical protein
VKGEGVRGEGGRVGGSRCRKGGKGERPRIPGRYPALPGGKAGNTVLSWVVKAPGVARTGLSGGLSRFARKTVKNRLQGVFLPCAPGMGSNLAVKVRYTLGSRKWRTFGPKLNGVSGGTPFPTRGGI